MVVNYAPPPTEFAVLVVHRTTRTPDTPFADHVLQSNSERRRYPESGRAPLTWIPTPIREAMTARAWSGRHAE